MSPVMLLVSVALMGTAVQATDPPNTDLSQCVTEGLMAFTGTISAGVDIKESVDECSANENMKGCVGQVFKNLAEWGLVAGEIAQSVATCAGPGRGSAVASCAADATKLVSHLALLVEAGVEVKDDCDGSDSETDSDGDDDTTGDGPSPSDLVVCASQIPQAGIQMYNIVEFSRRASDHCNATNMAKPDGPTNCATVVDTIFNGGAAALVSITTAIAACRGGHNPSIQCAASVGKFVRSTTGIALTATAMSLDCKNGTVNSVWAANEVLSRFSASLEPLKYIGAGGEASSDDDAPVSALTIPVVLGVTLSAAGLAAIFAVRRRSRVVSRAVVQDVEAEEGLVSGSLE